jgi:lauroyl/myristoyl acyltransferase
MVSQERSTGILPVLALSDWLLALVITESLPQAQHVSRFRSKRPNFLLLLEYGIYRCFESSFQYLPPRWVDAIGRTLGRIAHDIMPRRRAIVERNCMIAWGDSLSRDEVKALTKDVFIRNGANLLGSTRCMIMPDHQLQHHLAIDGAELVRHHLQHSSAGIIFALCHMGNWEILSRIASLVAPGVPAAAFYRPLNNPWMNRMMKRRRQRSGMKLFSNKEGFVQSVPLLREGGMLGILADQHAGRTGSRATFFGRPTACSPLAEVLHRRTGAAIFYVAVYRDAPAHWHIKITPHAAGVAVDTCQIMSGIEQSLNTSPADGFWVHDRWKQYKRALLKDPHSRDCLDHQAITKPRRWLLVGSRDSQIQAAATAAMKHVIDHADDAQVDVISTIPMHPQRGNWHQRSEKLTKQMEEIANQSMNPIDIIVYFCPIEEIPAQIDISYAYLTTGISPEKNHKFTVALTTQDSLTQEPTWWKFLAHLGLKNT